MKDGNINWNLVFANLHYREGGAFGKKVQAIARALCGILFKRGFERISIQPESVLCVKSMSRFDYDEIWSDIIPLVPNAIELNLDRRFGLSTLLFWRIFQLPKAVAKSASVVGFWDRAYATLAAVYYLELLRFCAVLRPEAIVSFSEMQSTECLIIQYFNSINVPTITLQHGLYINYGDEHTINRLNYEASCSTRFLAWGKETAELINKYNSKATVTVCGACRLSEGICEDDTFVVYVIFDADINEVENRQLLSVARSFAVEQCCEIMVGLHPKNDTSKYDLSGCFMLEKGHGYTHGGIVLGHTTTELVKLARRGKRVYKLKSDQPSNRYIPGSILFSSSEDLKSKYSSGDYTAWANMHIEYVGESALARYREYFSNKSYLNRQKNSGASIYE